MLLIVGANGLSAQSRTTDSLLQLKKNTSDKDTLHVSLLLQLSEVSFERDKLKSQAYAEEALLHAQKLNLPSAQSKALLLISRCHIAEGDRESALRLLQEGLKLSQKLPSEMHTADFLFEIGKTYFSLGNSEKALYYFSKALDAFRTNKQEFGEARSYRQLGNVYAEIGNINRAVEYYDRSVSIFKRLGNIKGVRENKVSLGFLRLEAGIWDAAAQLFEEVYEESKGGEVNVVATLGLAQVNLKKVERNISTKEKRELSEGARKLLFEARRQAELLNLEKYRTQSLYLIGESHRLNGETSKASLFLKEALEAANEKDFLKMKSKIFLSLAKTYEEPEQNNLSVYYYKNYIALQDSVQLSNRDDRLRSLQIQIATEENKQRLDKLSRKRETENREATYLRNLLLLALVTLFIVALSIFIRYREKRRGNAVLKDKNNKIRLQNQQLKVINNRLQNSEQELNEINRTKDRFFSIVAHDLRSPLSALKGYSGLIAQFAGKLSREEIKEMAEEQSKTIANLYDFLDSLLTWARSQMNSLELDTRPVPVKPIMDEMESIFEKVAFEKEILIKFHIEDNDLTVMADKNALQTVFRNLISNAIKFTEVGGEINISASQGINKNEVLIKVSDTGVGIPPQIVDKLFQIDEKHSTKGTSGEKGTGLGLMITKEFTEKSGGNISVKSKEGHGTTFTVSMPLATPKKGSILSGGE